MSDDLRNALCSADTRTIIFGFAISLLLLVVLFTTLLSFVMAGVHGYTDGFNFHSMDVVFVVCLLFANFSFCFCSPIFAIDLGYAKSSTMVT